MDRSLGPAVALHPLDQFEQVAVLVLVHPGHRVSLPCRFPVEDRAEPIRASASRRK